MKTLANCSSIEFFSQTKKISGILKEYVDDISKLRKAADDINSGTNVFSVIDYIFGDNIDKTMEVCGALCFKTGKEFAALSPENGDDDGIVAINEIIRSQRCISFFSTCINLKAIATQLGLMPTSKKSESSEQNTSST